MSEENKRKETLADKGWRSKEPSISSPPTQVDSGWRRDSSTDERKSTMVDIGWRTGKSVERLERQKDVVRHSKSDRRATETDAGWRSSNASSVRQPTQVDAGWRQEIHDTLCLESVISNGITNHFSTIDEFKDAVEKVSELKSSKGNVYSVKKTISRAGGESIILLCSNPAGYDVVAKVYYDPVNGQNSSISSRATILEYMSTEEGKLYTLAITDIGLIDFGQSKYYFEIMPFCENADLSQNYLINDKSAYNHTNAKVISFEQIVEITRQLNEALHSIHQAGIFHRDIKPENLYEINGKYKLGDFGIARIGAQGRLNMTTTFQFTPGYAPPEATLYGYSESTDYYSLGITLASLFEGKYIFESMTEEMELNAKQNERLPLTRVDPNREKLENLLNGLFRFSPKQRFGYEDVKLWLANHNYTGEGNGNEWPRPFRLLDDLYTDEKSMFYGITKDGKHWEEAKAMLYSKLIEQFFMSFRTDLARFAQIADELYRADNRDKGLSVFLKNIFPPGPIVWKGYTFTSLGELGNKMVSTKTPVAYSELLQNHCISHWLENTEGIQINSNTLDLVDSIEALSLKQPEVACFWFGNSFAPARYLKICKSTVTNVEELTRALFSSPNVFYQTDGFQKLIDRTDGADLYGFLYSLGYKEIIDKEWEELKSCDLFNKTCILLSMIDTITVKAGTNPKIIRDFFCLYGPIGLAVYVKELVDNGIYIALDSSGAQILDRISSFNSPTSGTIDDLIRSYAPLVLSVEMLQNNLIDNPYCIISGVYENKGVICSNLIGCFAFKIFDREAPLGFNAFIETASGGVN